MTGAQTRIADHISNFYQAADRTSEGAMAAHAYKQSVVELDDVIGRELVRYSTKSLDFARADCENACMIAGRTISHNDYGADWEDECLFPHRQRANQQA